VSLAGKAVLVTGAGRGIGLEIGRLLAARGMKVGVNDVDGQAAERACSQLCASGGLAQALTGDITNGAQVASLVERGEAELGPIWLLVNNAGVYHSAPAEELTEEAWDRDFAVDAKGTFLCSQAAIRRMIPRRAGRIVNVASIAGLIVRTRQLSYCAAKAAVIHFSRCLAVEVAPHGITVNCLCPGMTRTEMLTQSARERGLKLEDYEAAIPAGHMAVPEDHASLVAYLASEDAAHITGQVISVDGGQSLNLPLTLKS